MLVRVMEQRDDDEGTHVEHIMCLHCFAYCESWITGDFVELAYDPDLKLKAVDEFGKFGDRKCDYRVNPHCYDKLTLHKT